jgi:hypothetical protein
MKKTSFLALALLFSTGCAGRKIRATMQNDPDYEYGRKSLSGPSYIVRVIDTSGTIVGEVVAAHLRSGVNQRLSTKGYTMVDKAEAANFVFLFRVKSQQVTVKVPSVSAWGASWNHYGGGGGGFSRGAYSYDAQDQAVQLEILNCVDGKIAAVATGVAWPKSYKDNLLGDSKHLDTAIDKLLAGTGLLFASKTTSPNPLGEAGCFHD